MSLEQDLRLFFVLSGKSLNDFSSGYLSLLVVVYTDKGTLLHLVLGFPSVANRLKIITFKWNLGGQT